MDNFDLETDPWWNVAYDLGYEDTYYYIDGDQNGVDDWYDYYNWNWTSPDGTLVADTDQEFMKYEFGKAVDQYNKTYLDISEFPDGSGAIVYTSPSTGNLIRIKDTQLQKALSGEEYKYDFVKLAADPKLKDNIIYQAYKNNIYSVDIKEDLTKFVASKKYQVNKDLMNMATDYTSPIIGKYDAEGNWVGKTYKSTPDAPLGYQQYLFSNEEVAGGRILSTDLVKIGESLFNNPEVIFESIDKSIMGQVETELKIERTDTEIIDDIADEDISFDENPNNCN